MATDIVMDAENGQTLALQAQILHTTASDIVVDSPGRRSNPHGFRRAFVHDVSDGLTINFNGDYPGGLSLYKVSVITPKDSSAPRPAPGPGHLPFPRVPVLEILGGVSFQIGTASPSGGTIQTVDLGQVISDLNSQIVALTQRIAKLEAKP
ncbi:MAG TPA: hypothetical protein VNH44_12355 [Micropepsaceae bacterium]|nr:hypothetical protein [Micropepsaceae bacterium]